MHGIFGERFLGKREPGWHNLGQVFTDTPTATESLSRINMDYQVAKVPLSGQAFGFPIVTEQFALVREPTSDAPEPRVLGTCGKSYEVIQNADIATLLDPLTQEWPVETAGALEDGKAMFFTLDAGTATVSNGKADEEVKQYFLISNRHDEGRSLRVAYTPVRVVCANTLIAGLDAATVNIGITHHKGVHGDLALTIKLVSALRMAQQKTLSNFNAMACRVLTPEEVSSILLAAYVLPIKPAKVRVFDEVKEHPDALKQFSEAELLSLMKMRQKYDTEVSCLATYSAGARERYEAFSDEQPAFAGTAWALYNGITETECWRNGNKNADYDVLFGRRAEIMGRAYQAAMTVVTA